MATRRLGADAGARIWAADPPGPTLSAALVRWVDVDALESQGELAADQVALLRAEALVAYAESESAPATAESARAFLSRVSDNAPPDCQARRARLQQRLD